MNNTKSVIYIILQMYLLNLIVQMVYVPDTLGGLNLKMILNNVEEVLKDSCAILGRFPIRSLALLWTLSFHKLSEFYIDGR